MTCLTVDPDEKRRLYIVGWPEPWTKHPAGDGANEMSLGDWASMGSAVVAAASAVGSYVKWRQAKSVTALATEQANRSVAAAERLADATERLAASAESPAESSAAAAVAKAVNAATGDRTHAPWTLVPIPGSDHVRLRNETSSTLYAIRIDGFKVRDPKIIGVVHPFAGVELTVLRIWHPNNRIRITWHREADQSDPAQTWEDELPPRI